MTKLDKDYRRIENRWHVIPSRGGWVVRRDRAKRATKNFDSKTAAVEFARSLARKVAAGEVIVHRVDGRIESQQAVTEKGDAVLEVYSFGRGRAVSGI
ncbi:MAG TPA: DUF2188 domain-containing protein [Thermoanaerobaculia bacterium]